MTLLLHPNCSSKTELGFAAMTLSAAGHQRPKSPFLLTAGVNGEIWAGPFGRDAADRFYAGGPLCASEELAMLMDGEQTLVLAVEAVRDPTEDSRDWQPSLWKQVREVGAAPDIPARPPSRSEAPSSSLGFAEPETSGEACGAALLAAVETASRCVDAMSSARKVACEMTHALSAAQGKMEDLSGRMSALERALRRRAQVPSEFIPEPKDAQAKARASPALDKPQDVRLQTSLDFDGLGHLAWHVELSENSEPPRCLFHESLDRVSTSTTDFPDEGD